MTLSPPAPQTRTSPAAWLTAAILIAVGLWCSSGLLDIVRGANGIVRVAFLPPWWLLATEVAVLATVGAAAARAGRDPDVVLPLCAVGVLAVPYLPYLPDRLPALRAVAGPARPLIWLVASVLAVAPFVSSAAVRRRLSPSPLLVFLLSAAIFGAAAWRLTGTPLFPGGDEPHYLVVTQSLLHDGDLKIENNHQREEYRAYFNRPLKPDYLALGVDGQIYSIHPVGLPVLAMPAFALAGYRGVIVMLIAMAALAAAIMWRWTRDITRSPEAATFAWVAVALTAPYVFNSFTVYPEIPGALAVMIAVAWRPGSTTMATQIARGVAMGALPWLSTKYAPMAAVATLVTLARGPWTVRSALALLTPIAIAFAGWFAFFYWIWGTVSPSAPYGASEPIAFQHLMRGGPGLFFDQEYGVVAQAPVLVAAFAGLAQMLQSRGATARYALEVMAIFGALLVPVGGFHIWWGGTASPGRPVLSALLLLGLPIAWCFASTAARRGLRAMCHVLLAASLALACAFAAAQGGDLLNNTRDGTAALLEWVSPTWPLTSAFPTFVAGPLAAAIGRTLGWLALAAAIAWLIHRLEPRGRGASVLAALLFTFAGSVVLASLAVGATPLPDAMTPEGRGRVPLLDAFDSGRHPTAILYDPLSRITAVDALSRVTLTARPGMRTAPQPVELLWNARFALPAGEYRLRLRRSGAAASAATTLALQIGRSGPPLERWEVTGSPWEHRFAVPIDAELAGFRAPPDLSGRDGELQITPLQVVDASRRVARPPILGALRQDAATVFFHDDFVFPEPDGFWTRGRATAEVTYVVPASSPAAIDLVVTCGPVSNRVALATRGWQERLDLEAGAKRRVAVPTVSEAALGARIAPLTISVQEGFVPADVEPSTTDRRFLGCWIAVEKLVNW